MRWIIGTSGFAYSGWKGTFYPRDLPRERWLEFYQREFGAVELNVTFYRTPRESTVRQWASQARAGFRFVLKVPRVVSHIRRLKECAESFRIFWRRARLLGDRLGALLIQLPPSLAFEPRLLDGFLEEIPKGVPPLAWEPRHRSFAAEEAIDWFRTRKQPLVVADSGGRFPTIRAVTAPPAYLRFHGPAGLYSSPYSAAQLAEYAAWTRENVPARAEVYAFFNNDAGGHAVINARQLLDLTTVSRR